MIFVSGVLFARETRDGSLESEKQIKGRREWRKWEEERFRDFGKELPKSWQIEEPGLCGYDAHDANESYQFFRVRFP